MVRKFCAGIQISRETEVSEDSSVRSAATLFQLIYDLHSSNFGSARYGPSRESSPQDVESGFIFSQLVIVRKLLGAFL